MSKAKKKTRKIPKQAKPDKPAKRVSPDRPLAKRIFVSASAFVAGAGIMIVEMAGIRVLAPWFGNSLYTWTGLIGVVLISISIGYYLGGYIADKLTNWKILAHLLALASVSVIFVPVLHALIETSLSTTNVIWGPVLASLFLFAFPGIVMGAITPMAIRLTSSLDQDRHIGISAGQVGMLGTLGSVVGTFASGFLLIPFMQLKIIFLCLCVVLGALAAIGYILFSEGPMKSVVSFLLILCLPAMWHVAHDDRQGAGILYEKTTYYHRIMVSEEAYESGRVLRKLSLDSTAEGAQIIGSKELPIPYQKFWELIRVFNVSPKSAVFIGGGAFGMPEALADAFPNMQIEVIELDPEVIEVGKRFFGLAEYQSIKPIAGDARNILRNQEATYDLIFGDAYNGVRYVPAHLVTREFFELAHSRMTSDGTYMMNIITAMEGDNADLYRAVGTTLSNVFDHVYVFATHPQMPDMSQNIIFVATERDVSVAVSIAAADLSHRAKDYFAQSYVGKFAPDSMGGMELTDQRNPVEFIVAEAFKKDTVN